MHLTTLLNCGNCEYSMCSGEENFPLQFLFFNLIVSPKWVMGDRPTFDRPQHDQRHHFLINSDPRERNQLSHFTSWKKQTIILAILNVFAGKEHFIWNSLKVTQRTSTKTFTDITNIVILVYYYLFSICENWGTLIEQFMVKKLQLLKY